MTYVKDVFGRDLQLFDKFFVGFDDHLNKLAKLHDEMAKNAPSYPPFNIKKIDEDKHVIEIAIAGFDKDDIEIDVADGKLFVRGNTRGDTESTGSYIYKGIADRAFTRSFVLGEFIEVKSAQVLNGMLRVALERVVPEHKKPKKIQISDRLDSGWVVTQPQLLVEQTK
jgi:molecular chaperone IbpA